MKKDNNLVPRVSPPSHWGGKLKEPGNEVDSGTKPGRRTPPKLPG